MSSEWAGVHTSGALNREKARDVLLKAYPASTYDADDAVLDALEACVVLDPRIARIEALCTQHAAGSGWKLASLIREVLK